MIIIPAIDIIDGKCVRLSKGDYDTQKTYSTNPLEVAKSFEAIGITHLHLVDLDGAKSSQIKNQKVLEKIATNTQLKIDFGGGIKSQKDIEIAFNSGANQITGGSIAIQNPELFEQWIATYGAEKIILGADCKNRKIATNGWLKSSETEVIQFISDYEKKGIRSVICTDIEKDGMLQGASEELYTDILAHTSVQLIASGGVSKLENLITLKNMGCHAAIVGKAIYEGNISMKELEKLC